MRPEAAQRRKYVIRIINGRKQNVVRPYTMAEAIENFHTSYDILPQGYATPCWIYKGYKNPKEYGRIYVNGEQQRAHRFSWELHFGKIPLGKEVLHKCDNPLCVNPTHLFLGDQKTNVLDAVGKGRWTTGRKLKEQQVLEIRRLHASGQLGYRKLSAMFGMSKGAILLIVRRLTWTHLPP